MNKANSIKKIALAASILLAAALAFSCSSDGEEGNGQGGGSSSSVSSGGDYDGSRRIITKVYELKNKTDSSFAYIGTDYYNCGEGGLLIPDTINYSISNNALVWQAWGDTLNFTGTSNNLMDAWTRTLDINSSCKLAWNSIDYRFSCKENYDVIKAEFTENTITLTHDYCFTDHINEDLTNYTAGVNGWKARLINCDTYEVYKGDETVTVNMAVSSEDLLHGMSYIYKGNSCTENFPTMPEREKACRDAWNKVQIEGGDSDDLWDYYREFLKDIEHNSDSFMECFMNDLPEEFWKSNNEYEDFEESAMPKMLLKKANAKIFPFLIKQ